MTIPGTIIDIQVKVGDTLKKGQTVLILEAMKMETEIQASSAGVVKEIFCKKGDKVTPEQILISIDNN